MFEALELVSDGGIISYHTYIAIIHVGKVSGPNLQLISLRTIMKITQNALK
jgi:hypothetical protein